MKDFKIYLSIAAAIFLLYVIAEYNKPNPINWTPTLYYKHKIPLGTYIIHNQLNQLFPGAKVIKTNASIYTALKNLSSTPGNYLVFAKDVTINKTDFTELIKYIAAGNAVFISSYKFNGFLADTLQIALAYESAKGNAQLNFTNRKLERAPDYEFEKDISNQYFTEFDTAGATVIGKNNYGHATYLTFKFGKGSLYLCSNPGVFSNYSLLNKQGADYAAKALSYLPVTGRIYWDEYQNGDIAEDESLLRVFFTNPALEWAYFLSLAGAIIFVLFEIKRRQRVIPVIEPLSNSTLEFVTVVGQVYYEQRNNANIAQKKILYLLVYLRDEYQLRTNVFDEEFIDKLSAKLDVEKAFAVELISYINYINNQEKVTDRELIELDKMIEKLYIKSRYYGR